MSILSFLKSKYGKRQLLLVLAANVGIFLVVYIVLALYTRHGESISVPDLKGKTEAEARAMLEELDLELLIADSLFVENASPGTIREQTPKPGSFVKSGRIVSVSVFKKTPPMVPINVKEGDHLQIAALRLTNKGIKYLVKYAPNNSMVGVVMRVQYNGKDVPFGMMLERGQTVTLTVGEAGSATVPVPKLFGMTYFDAVSYLNSINLAGQGYFDPPATSKQDSLNYHVCRQEPKYSASAIPLPAGHFVDFWLSKEPCLPDTTDTPSTPIP